MARTVTVKVTDRDRGWRRLQRNILRSKKANVTVGVHGSEDPRNQSGAGNVTLAAVHEFGSRAAGIPERSFIRRTVDRNVTEYRRLAKKLGPNVYWLRRPRLTVAQALNIWGAKVASDMRQTIARTPGEWPELKPATIAAREFGGVKPLLDTGQLQRSIKHKVNK